MFTKGKTLREPVGQTIQLGSMKKHLPSSIACHRNIFSLQNVFPSLGRSLHGVNKRTITQEVERRNTRRPSEPCENEKQQKSYQVSPTSKANRQTHSGMCRAYQGRTTDRQSLRLSFDNVCHLLLLEGQRRALPKRIARPTGPFRTRRRGLRCFRSNCSEGEGGVAVGITASKLHGQIQSYLGSRHDYDGASRSTKLGPIRIIRRSYFRTTSRRFIPLVFRTFRTVYLAMRSASTYGNYSYV